MRHTTIHLLWNFSSGIGGAMPAHMGPAFG